MISNSTNDASGRKLNRWLSTSFRNKIGLIWQVSTLNGLYFTFKRSWGDDIEIQMKFSSSLKTSKRRRIFVFLDIFITWSTRRSDHQTFSLSLSLSAMDSRTIYSLTLLIILSLLSLRSKVFIYYTYLCLYECLDFNVGKSTVEIWLKFALVIGHWWSRICFLRG